MSTWEELSARRERNELPWLLEEAIWKNQLDLDEMAKGIEDAWTSAEFPLSSVKRSEWRSFFATVGFLEGDVRSTPPSTPMTLFRGASREKRFGLSWTDDIERAGWFAARWGESSGGARLWTVVAPPAALLAHFPSSRNESEWVIDPRGLKVREIESQPLGRRLEPEHMTATN